jgi:UDP-N-acetylglucosamine 2-epimerase (non-hydrolysing)
MKHVINGKRASSNDYIMKYLNDTIEPGSTILDLGCGPKLYSSPFIQRCSKIVTVDAWENVQPDIVADLENTSVFDITKGEKFDYVLMIDFIEHLDKNIGLKLIENVKRICNKEIILLTPLEEIWTDNHENVEDESLWCYGNKFDIHKSLWHKSEFKEWIDLKLPGLDNYFVGTFNPNTNDTRILTILGTRPEIIRLSRIIPKLDKICNHYILHTGQNFDPNLSDIFFNELGIRQPDFIVDNNSSNLSDQLSNIYKEVERCINHFKPDKVLILGDTNSGLSSIICEKLGVPVYHMEAGNRCYDLKVPEEKNRKVIDSTSSYNLPYTELSRQNLLREGFANNKIFVTGNPIKEVLDFYKNKIDASNILTNLNLEKEKFILVTAHRAENVDVESRLKSIFTALDRLSKEYKIVFSCHPRTKQKIQKFGIVVNSNIYVTEPLGFFDFVNLEKNCFMTITDSGTVQEELCIFNKPTITIRDSTERPETVWCGSNIVSGLDPKSILQAYETIKTCDTNWIIPLEYNKNNVSDTVVNILLGNNYDV